MSEFQLRLFGGLELKLGKQDLTRQLSVKARGLICYLALTGRPHSRLALAGMFWGEKPESDALRSLRVELTKIRKYLSPHIDASRQALAFTKKESCWLDTDAFDHHLRLVKNVEGAAARVHLREAAQLYVGDFLEGYQAGDAYGFEEWMMAQRESYRSQALAALEKLVELNIHQQEYEAGIESAAQILTLDPWREGAHRSLMWLYYQNGQRGAALRQYEVCRAVLENEVGVEPEEQTIALWQKIKQQEGVGVVNTQPLPLTKSASESVPFQAPSQVPYFGGRTAELDRLMTVFETEEEVKIVCVAGMGGVGKTSFCIQFAHQHANRFIDGVLWADAASDPATIAEKWAVAYGYDFRGISKLEDRLTAVREMLTEKQALIVLDDVTVAARVKPLLPTAGESLSLITTRNADMAYALGAELINLDVLTLENGRSLLSSIIGDSRVQDEQITADEICNSLQNLPLALAIAGQYLVARPRRRLTDFLRRLQDSVLLDVADNEGVVRASFDISWTALDQVQQRVFALLAVFEGRSFTAAAMAYIADLDFYEMQDHLDTLSARSLLIEQGREYYRQHALLSHFAEEKLEDRQAPSLRKADYYLGFTDDYNVDYKKLNMEWENLDATIQIMAQEEMWKSLFRINQNLNQAWFAQGLFDKAQSAYQLAYQGALLLKDDGQVGENLYRQGMAILERGQYDEAYIYFERALSIFDNLRDRVSVSDVEYELARIHIFQARYDQAKDLLNHGLQIRQELNDKQGVGQFKYRQAMLLLRLQKFEELLEFSQEVVELQEHVGNILDLIRTLRLLVWAYCSGQNSDYDMAQKVGERALTLARELGDQGEQAMALSTLSEVSRRQENFQKGLQQAQESLSLLEKMGDIASLASVTLRICLIYRDMGKFQDSLDYGEKALKMYSRVSDRLGVAWALGNIGYSYNGMGEIDKANENFSASEKIAEELNDEYWLNAIDWMREQSEKMRIRVTD